MGIRQAEFRFRPAYHALPGRSGDQLEGRRSYIRYRRYKLPWLVGGQIAAKPQFRKTRPAGQAPTNRYDGIFAALSPHYSHRSQTVHVKHRAQYDDK